MYRHEHFDLRLHDDEELAPLVGGRVVERTTLHEWPLSCVQHLRLAGGRRLIYKAQSGPTVESEFYAGAASDLLPRARTVYQTDGYACMLIEFVDAPRLEELGLPEEEVVRIGRLVMGQIASIEGGLPHYLDLSDEGKWRQLVNATVGTLRDLIADGKFSLVDEPTVRGLERWASSGSALSTIRTRPGYVHGDLAGDNLFVLPDGHRVIDWQRPILGPTDLDLAKLLGSLGFDPLPHVGAGIVRVLKLLGIHWCAACKARWIPEGEVYDGIVARLASELLS